MADIGALLQPFKNFLPLPRITQQRVTIDTDIVQHQVRGPLTRQADTNCFQLTAVTAGINHKDTLLAVGILSGHQDKVRHSTIGHHGLGAIENPTLRALRGCYRGRHCRGHAHIGNRGTEPGAAGSQWLQVTLLLLRGAKLGNGQTAQHQRSVQGHWRDATTLLFQYQAQFHQPQPGAARRFRDGYTQQSLLRQRAP